MSWSSMPGHTKHDNQLFGRVSALRDNKAFVAKPCNLHVSGVIPVQDFAVSSRSLSSDKLHVASCPRDSLRFDLSIALAIDEPSDTAGGGGQSASTSTLDATSMWNQWLNPCLGASRSWAKHTSEDTTKQAHYNVDEGGVGAGWRQRIAETSLRSRC